MKILHHVRFTLFFAILFGTLFYTEGKRRTGIHCRSVYYFSDKVTGTEWGYCWRIVDWKHPPETARQLCEKINGRLPAIDSVYKSEKFAGFLQKSSSVYSRPSDEEVWVSSIIAGTWKSSNEKATYESSLDSATSSWASRGSCVLFNVRKKKWRYERCSSEKSNWHPLVCEETGHVYTGLNAGDLDLDDGRNRKTSKDYKPPCPSEYIMHEFKCFYIHQTPVPPTQAEAVCKKFGGVPAYFNSVPDQQRVQRYLKRENVYRNVLVRGKVQFDSLLLDRKTNMFNWYYSKGSAEQVLARAWPGYIKRKNAGRKMGHEVILMDGNGHYHECNQAKGQCDTKVLCMTDPDIEKTMGYDLDLSKFIPDYEEVEIKECAAGYTPWEFDCFSVLQIKPKPEEANDECRKTGGKILTFATMEELKRVKAFMLNEGKHRHHTVNDNVVIDMLHYDTDKNNYTWHSTGESVSQVLNEDKGTLSHVIGRLKNRVKKEKKSTGIGVVFMTPNGAVILCNAKDCARRVLCHGYLEEAKNDTSESAGDIGLGDAERTTPCPRYYDLFEGMCFYWLTMTVSDDKSDETCQATGGRIGYFMSDEDHERFKRYFKKTYKGAKDQILIDSIKVVSKTEVIWRHNKLDGAWLQKMFPGASRNKKPGYSVSLKILWTGRLFRCQESNAIICPKRPICMIPENKTLKDVIIPE